MARAGAKGDDRRRDGRGPARRWLETLGAGLNALDQVLPLAERDLDGRREEAPTPWRSGSANMAFGQDGYPIEPAYLERDRRDVRGRAGPRRLQRGPGGGARRRSTAGSAARPHGPDPELLSPANVTEDTRLVLVNADLPQGRMGPGRSTRSARRPDVHHLAGRRIKVPDDDADGGQDVALAAATAGRPRSSATRAPDGTTPLAMTLILPDDLARLRAVADAGDARCDPVAKLGTERKRIAEATVPPGRRATGLRRTSPTTCELYLPRFGIDTRAEPRARPRRRSGMRRPFDAARRTSPG